MNESPSLDTPRGHHVHLQQGNFMEIASITATPVFISVTTDVVGVRKEVGLSMCVVRIETRSGLVGWGMTAITEEEVVAEIVNAIVAPNLVGEDARAYERIWHRLYWLLSPRGQTGYAAHAIAAIDTAIWDLLGKASEQPVWQLLGAARDRVPVYATFGFSFLEREALAEAAVMWKEKGFDRLKMTVGDKALARAGADRPIDDVLREDLARVRAVRDAVGDEVRLYLDANCNLDLYHASKFAQAVEECGIEVFEEPVTQNDIPSLVQLRERTSIPLSCGQNEGLAFRFRDLLTSGAVDLLQPNVVISGGYTQCMKIAGMASAFNVPIANGGAWSYHNMHLHAGLANGGLVEHHYLAVECYKVLYPDLTEPEDGWLRLPASPGLGFEPDTDILADLARRPTSAGVGKA